MGRGAETVTTKTREQESSAPSSSGEKLFAKLAAFYAATGTHVERAMLFGFDCLRTDGKVFAKLHNSNLVMKLPAKRVGDLIASGRLSPYNWRGRSMKEWAVVTTTEKREAIALAEESRAFTKD